MWWLLLLSLLVALIGTWRNCSSAEDEGEGEPTVVYDRAFDEVIVRAPISTAYRKKFPMTVRVLWWASSLSTTGRSGTSILKA